MKEYYCKVNEAPTKARSITVEIDYPGSVISVNHYTGRARDGHTYVKPEARAFMTELGWALKTAHLEDWELPLLVTCSARFTDEDKRKRGDLSNLSKCILDAIEDLTGINDRNYRWQDGEVTYGDPPVLFIMVREIG